MHKNWPELAASLSGPLRDLRGGAPEVMKGFSAIARAALEAKALDTKTKELIALAIGVAGHCDGCIGFHAKALARLKTPRAELMETLAVAVYMGGGPSLMFAADAIAAFEEFGGASA